MTALETILKVFLNLQIILALSTAFENERYSDEEINTSQKGGQIIELEPDGDEMIPYEDDSKNKDFYEDSAKPYGKDEIENASSQKFKYTVNTKDEPGFDLTPEEKETFKIWKDGVIPYYIDVVSFSDKVLRDKIRNFLQLVNSLSSVNFIELPGPPADENERWVFFINRRGLLGCADHSVENFTNKGVQQVVLGYDCMATKGEIAEAVMSIVGVPAQHNAPDRDKYIKVNIENVLADKKYLFEKLTDKEWLFHDLPYDFDSVTHYDINKYSANGRASIEVLKNPEDLKPVTEFSATDILKIKMLYNYIARNKIMQTPVCEKLFKISSQYRPGPTSKPDTPRKKPNRYTGISGSESYESNDKTESSEFNEDNKNNEENNNEEELNNDDNGEKYTENDEELYQNDVKANPQKEADIIDTGNVDSRELLKESKIKKIRELKAMQILKGREKAKKKMVDILHHLSDYESGEMVQLKAKKLNGPIKDPLVLLSDYQTDERVK